MATVSQTQPPSGTGEPTWEIATLFPNQGEWTEGEYLRLSNSRRIELSDGRLEFLPMPTEEHQLILAFLNDVFRSFVLPRNLGKVLFAGLRVRLWEGKIREPDLVFMAAAHAARRENRYWHGADLAVEIVSGDDPERDLETKREEYAKAGIPEYWIVDPRDATITVLTLNESGEAYDVAGRYARGQQAASVLLEGLTVDVTKTFSQC